MSTKDQYGPPLEKCIQAMRDQMAKPENVEKPNWHSTRLKNLIDKLNYNLYLLTDGDLEDEDAMRRAANIANYAWMIADHE
jgi:hypothetical protein